jgi:hypothetical protein
MKSKVIRFTNKVDSAVDENELIVLLRKMKFVTGGKSTLITYIFLSLMVQQKDSFICMVENMKLCADK